jgi:hypothetical protein
MSMSLTHVRLAPVDLFNMLRLLRRQKARTSPRSLRYELTPGQPGRIVLEPWGHVVPITAPWVYDGPQATTIRVWGRDRLRPLARLLGACRSVDVFLAGYGLPSFYLLDLGPVRFLLALSGWTDNDWTGGASFDLLTRRAHVTAAELMRVYEALRQSRCAIEQDLAKHAALDLEKVPQRDVAFMPGGPGDGRSRGRRLSPSRSALGALHHAAGGRRAARQGRGQISRRPSGA